MRRRKTHLAMLLAILTVAALYSESLTPKYWWQVELVISTRGNYEFKAPFAPFKGEFAFDYVMKTDMERDKGDYILFKGKNHTKNITWNPNGHDPQAQETDKGLAGIIDLVGEFNNIIRQEGKIQVACGIFSVPLPYSQENPLKNLIMPHTAGNELANPKLNYNNGITQGSNVVEILENRIYSEKTVKETFDWTWEKDEGDWYSSHKVIFTVTITRLLKK